MFVRLTRPVRAKAGWFVALLYLFCVLAPAWRWRLAMLPRASCTSSGRRPPRICKRVLRRTMRPRTSIMRYRWISMRWIPPMPATPRQSPRSISTTARAPRTVLRHAVRFGDRSRSARGRKALVQPISLCVSENFQRLPGRAPLLPTVLRSADPT